MNRKILLLFLLILAISSAQAITPEQVKTFIENNGWLGEHIEYVAVGQWHHSDLWINTSKLSEDYTVNFKDYLKVHDVLREQILDALDMGVKVDVMVYNVEGEPLTGWVSVPIEATIRQDRVYRLRFSWLRTDSEYYDWVLFDILKWAAWSPTSILWTLPVDGSAISGTRDEHITIQDSAFCNGSWRYENSTDNGNWNLLLGNITWNVNETDCGGANNACVTRQGAFVTANFAHSGANKWEWNGWSDANSKCDDALGANYGSQPEVGIIRFENMLPYDNGTVCDLWYFNGAYGSDYCASAHVKDINFSFNGVNWFTFTIPGADYSGCAGKWYPTGQNDIVVNKTWDLHINKTTAAPRVTVDAFMWACGGFDSNLTDSWDTTAVADGSYGMRIMAVNGTGATNITEIINVTVDNNPPTMGWFYPPDFTGLCGLDSCGYVDTNIRINISAIDLGTGIDDVWCMLDGVVSDFGNYTLIQDAGGNFYNDTTVTNDDYTVLCWANDSAGTMSSINRAISIKWYGLTDEQNATLYTLLTTGSIEVIASDIGVNYILVAVIPLLIILYFVLMSYEKENPLFPLFALIFSVALTFKGYAVVMTADLVIQYFPMVWVAIYGFIFTIVSAGFLILDSTGRFSR